MSKQNNVQLNSLCTRFGRILGATGTVDNGTRSCTVMKLRNNIKPTILGRRSKSFIVIPQMFTFESVGRDGRALCSGETVILQSEINPFITRLRKHGIIVTALHNHYLFERPRLMFIHFEAIDRPLDFARKTRDALRVLTTREVHPIMRRRRKVR